MIERWRCQWCATAEGPCTCEWRCEWHRCRAAVPCPGPTRHGHRAAVAGAPVWCRPCQARIVSAVTELPEACARLAPGQVAAPSTVTDPTRRTTVTGSPSLSPAWDEIDAVTRWAVDAEDRLRCHLDHSPLPARRRLLDDAVAYLAAQSTAWLCTPWAVEDGRAALTWHHRITTATGFDELVHRLDAPCPAPGCGLRALVRENGSDHVVCRACRNAWPEEEYHWLTRLIAAEYRGEP